MFIIRFLIYEGEFDHDLRNGFGTMDYVTKNEKYSGYWKNGKRNGDGKYWYSNGKIRHYQLGNFYNG